MYIDARRKAVIKNGINDYKFMKEELEQRISKGDDLKELSKFLCRFKDSEITSLEDYLDYGYLDFIYKDVNMCVSYDKEKTSVSDTFQIWDDKGFEYIWDDYLTIKDYEELINTSKEETLSNAVADLKFYDAHNLKDDYDKCLEDIIVFLKEEF